MILLNTYFNVDESLTRDVFFKLILDRLGTQFKIDESTYTGKDTNLEKSSIFDFYDSPSTCPAEYTARLTHEGHTKSVYVGNYENAFLYSQKTDTEGASSFVTYYVLDEQNHVLSVRKECIQDAATFIPDVSLTIPEIIKLLFWNEYVSSDESSNGKTLLWDNKPLFIRKADADFAKGIISGKEIFDHPVIYISPTSNGAYNIDCNVLARDLMGQAHVVAEASPFVTNLVKKDMDDKIYPFDDDESHMRAALYCGGHKIDVSFNMQSSNDTVLSIQKVISGLTLPSNCDFTKLRENYAFTKLGKDDSELSGLFESILQEKDLEIKQLRDSLDKMRQTNYQVSVKAGAIQDNLDKHQDMNGNAFAFESDEKDLYADERKDIVLKILQKEYDSMKDDINLSRSRKANVLKDVLEHNFPSGTDTKYTELLKSAFNDGALTKEGIGRLQAVGFMISKEERNAHWQFKFGDDRYVAIFSATPSDKARSVKNFVSGYSNILFGY